MSTRISERTFELLAGLHQSPTRKFYAANQVELKEHVEKPIQDLMGGLAERLPAEAKTILETKRNIFARILKNDWGRGGAWDFYWAAFYPKGQKRISGAQLFVCIFQDRLEYGFYIGEHDIQFGERTRRLLREGHGAAVDALLGAFEGKSFLFADRETIEKGEGLDSLADWISSAPAGQPLQARRILTKEEVLARSPENVAEEIATAFADLFPLMLLTTADEPWVAIASYLGAEVPAPTIRPTYTIDDLRRETGFETAQIQRWLQVLQRKKQIVLQGPPGTGKTYVAQRLARYLVAGTSGVVEVVQFHPAYAYEDFMQGIRPDVRDGVLRYDLEPGQFLRFCDRARKAGDVACVLIIDEINRANLARVFGELMYLLEYRDEEIPLAAGGTPFRVPQNVFLIGTMNTADRSITRMDHALRRRFSFIRLRPEYDVLRRHLESQGLPSEGLVRTLTEVNAAIEDPNYAVGISYFMLTGSKLKDHLVDVWQCEIEPYLEEYFYDDIQRVEPFRWQALVAGPLADWS